GADSENPFSYLEHASFLFQYAARYGSSKVSPERLRLAPNQTKRSGMNLIKYFENWNEPDRWWNGRKGYFRPFEYAAMCSADYDGHRGKLGPDAGMKNADPNAQMAMAGLTQLDTNYIKAMKLWSDVHRNGSFPADILNFHYCPENPEGTALSPESDHMKEKFTSLLKFCEGKLPGKEVWVTEFGYDTNEGSPRKCPAISPYTREEVQAQWLVRAALEASAVPGLRHFMIYMLRNVRDDGGQQFQTCGLTSSEPTHHIPKPSWYFVSSTKKILTNSHFHKDMSVSRVRVYSYINNESGVQTLAVWSPSANNTVIADFKLRFSFKVKRAIIQQLQFNKDQPVENSKEVEEGKNYMVLNVSETPVFVKLYK
ncbi:MAG: hypothetical protein K2Q22_14400, partial [Cytophagales bacterium]|nr:hypothetical protein [Cytophagales bacterium]